MKLSFLSSIPGRLVDERFLDHRRRSSTFAMMAGALVSGGLLEYHLIHEHRIDWEIASVFLTCWSLSFPPLRGIASTTNPKSKQQDPAMRLLRSNPNTVSRKSAAFASIAGMLLVLFLAAPFILRRIRVAGNAADLSDFVRGFLLGLAITMGLTAALLFSRRFRNRHSTSPRSSH